jgi:hypothetical protein
MWIPSHVGLVGLDWSSTDHCLRAISRVRLDRRWREYGRQNGTLRILVGLPILFFQMWHFGSGLKAKRRREGLYALCEGFYLDIALFDRILVDFELLKIWCVCVCAGDYATVDHLIWHCERLRLERHRFIVVLAALNMSIGIPFRDLCALKNWCAVKCCLDFLSGFGIKLWWFGPSPVFHGLEMYSLGP